MFSWWSSGFGPNGDGARDGISVCDLNGAGLDNEIEIAGTQKVDPISPVEPRGDTGCINGTRWETSGGKRKGEARITVNCLEGRSQNRLKRGNHVWGLREDQWASQKVDSLVDTGGCRGRSDVHVGHIYRESVESNREKVVTNISTGDPKGSANEI